MYTARALLSVVILAASSGLSSASTLTPKILPLVVRNPYLSTWLANAREEPWTEWPMFYTGQHIGLSVLASVPSHNHSTNTIYPLLGRAYDSLNRDSKHYNISFPTYLGAQYDASTTNLTYTIPKPSNAYGDAVELTLSFLSPITPTSTLRQAIPASYLTVYVKGSFDIVVYIDVNGQWATGDDTKIEWSLEHTNIADGKSLKTWRVKRQHQLLFTESRDRAEWGEFYFTGPHDVRYQAGTSAKVRKHFGRNSSLTNEVDNEHRSVMDEEPVFAFSKRFDLGGSHNSSRGAVEESSALFTIAHLQNPVTQFASARGLTFMRPLWKSYFLSDESLIAFHYSDFGNASVLAANYSAQLSHDAYKSGSDNYKDILALTARQVMGATSFSGTPDNPILFLKEISSNGNAQTVDVIFPSFPFFLYTNPRWLAYLLEPIIEHTLSGQYPNQYTLHDLGTHFPNITGHPDGNDERMPVEESGDILIMALALLHSLDHDEGRPAQSIWSVEGQPRDAFVLDALPAELSPFGLPPALETRNSISGLDDQWGGASAKNQAKKWLTRAYPMWKQWTSYLVKYSLRPENQLCTDDFAGELRLQTNLALKGIIGIKAMGELAEITGHSEDAEYYRIVSNAYIKKWEKYGMARDGARAKLAYHWQGSWTTLYSLYADALLCFHPHTSVDSAQPSPLNQDTQTPLVDHSTKSNSSSNFVPDHIYKAQSRWYSTAMQKYGLPLDSRHLYTKSDWQFEAAAVASKSTRKKILDRIALWLNETVIDRPFSDLYKTETDGGFPPNGPNFLARPVVGGHFAFLTLERACGGKGSDAFLYEV